MKKKQWLVIGGVILVSAVAAALFTVLKKPATQTYSSTEHGVSLIYPKSLVSQNISEDDKKNRIILRLNRGNPATLVTVRYEEGLQAVATVAKQAPLDLILSTISKRYPKQFPDYNKLEEHRIKISNRDAAEVIFTYKGPEGVLIKQRFVAVMKDSNKAFYIAAQTAEDTYNKTSKEFDNLYNTISIN